MTRPKEKLSGQEGDVVRGPGYVTEMPQNINRKTRPEASVLSSNSLNTEVEKKHLTWQLGSFWANRVRMSEKQSYRQILNHSETLELGVILKIVSPKILTILTDRR